MDDSKRMCMCKSLSDLLANHYFFSLTDRVLKIISKTPVFTVLCDHIVESLLNNIAVIKFEDVRMIHLLEVRNLSDNDIEILYGFRPEFFECDLISMF
jgi:hypothetical protein